MAKTFKPTTKKETLFQDEMYKNLESTVDEIIIRILDGRMKDRHTRVSKKAKRKSS